MVVGQKLGPFNIEKEIGVGAMGAVYLGRYTKTGAKVAVKVMIPGTGFSESAAARFEREAAILKQFNHPNIVRLYGVGKSSGTRYYAMEYVEGESLDKVLTRRGRFTWEETITLGQQLCAALQHAHEQGIVHRDLKPSNLMILADGTLKLTDFGIAKDLDVTGLTGAHCTVGTAAYMSPEQCKGDQNLTHKSDLYSLGIVFYELITGNKPFNASNAMDMFMQHVKKKPERPSRIILDLPVWLDTLICQLLEKKTENRPMDAAMVYAALGSIKEKVETQRSAGVDAVRAQMFGGDTTAPKLDKTDKEVSRALLTGKGRSRKRKKGEPIYRRGWFVGVALVAFLVSLGGLLWWANLPPSPATLHAQAARLMNSGKPEDREKAREDPIAKYLRYYGSQEDEQTREMNAWADRMDMEQADALLQNYLRKRKKFTIPANTENEEQGFKAARAEEAGDLDSAIATWTELKREAGRTPWGLLAGHRLNQLDEIEKYDDKGNEHLKYVRDFGREPKMEAPEREAFTAYRCEHFADVYQGTNDLALAQEHWQEMKEKYTDDMDQRYWYLLAARRVRALKGRVPVSADPDAARKELIVKALAAAPMVQKDSQLDAGAVYRNVIALYENQPLLKEFVDDARQRLKELDAKPK